MAKTAYKLPKFPRIVVSAARHKALAAKAKKADVSMSEYCEAVFKKTK